MKRFLRFIVMIPMLACLDSLSADEGYPIFKCKSETGAYTFQGAPCIDKSKTVSAWRAPVANLSHQKLFSTFVIRSSRHGGYWTSGFANGIASEFQVDTGADYVTLSQSLATRAGMICGKTSLTNTANRAVTQCESVIRELNFGMFLMRNVKAMIVPNLNEPVLGMNVLSLFHIEHENGVMTITYKH